MRNILLFLCGSLLSVCLIWLANFLILPLTEPWLKDIWFIKEQIASNTQKRKIIVVGGSSSLFGFDGGIIERGLQQDYAFVNLGSHAGLPLNFHLNKAIEFARRGDIVIAPLEFTYYTSNQPSHQDGWYIQNMLSWGNEYRKFIPTENLIFNFFLIDTQEILKTMIKKILSLLLSAKIESIRQIYTAKNLDAWGDFCIQQKSRLSPQERFSYLAEDMRLSPFFISEITRTKDIFEKEGVRFFLAYPPTLRNQDFDLRQKAQNIQKLEQELKSYGLEFIGRAKDFHYSSDNFFDTEYHLNCNGSRQRSQAFVEALNAITQL